MSIRRKLLFSFTLAGGLLLAIAAFAYLGLSRVVGISTTLATRRMPSTRAVGMIRNAQGDLMTIAYALQASDLAEAQQRALLAGVEEHQRIIDEGVRAWESTPHTPKGNDKWGTSMGLLRLYRSALTELLELQNARGHLVAEGIPSGDARTGTQERRVREALARLVAAGRPLDAALEDLDDYVNGVAVGEGQRAVETGAATSRLLLAVALAAAAAMLVFAVLLTRNVQRTLARVGETLDRLAAGDVPDKLVEDRGEEFNRLRDSTNSLVGTVTTLVDDTAVLAAAAVEGRLAVRADATRHQGAFRRLVEGVNATVATLVGHLDSLPAPAMIVDRDLRIRYLNRTALEIVAQDGMQVVGQRCADLFKTGDCNTERCACSRAMAQDRPASSETAAHPAGKTLEISYSAVPIRDRNKSVIGAFEAIADVTAIRGAMRRAEKVSAYQAQETDKVVCSLGRLARGDLAIDATVAPGDVDTAEAKKAFETISSAIRQSAGAVQGLTQEAAALSEAAIAGRLSTRADAARHQGDYRKVVQGMNETLDAILAPMRDLAAVLESLAAGSLDARTDPSRYKSESRALVEGVNVTLGALLAPAEEAAQVLKQLAQRDLRARMSGDYQGDHARLKEATNATAEALHSALAQVASAVQQVSSASSQIAASAQAVASGASEQASSLSETTTSIDSVAASTGQAADNASQANTLAHAARSAAQEGSSSVEQMLEVMVRIRASSESTAQIIKDINDIAFQTNLLALNAAVEAARAGDAGRGFAVVAEEVRSLAMRAKEAASRTEQLIGESVKQAGAGEEASRRVSIKLGEIVGGVGKVSAIVSEIATSARDQAAGIDQVRSAIAEMDKVTQQNAASAEESSSAASELSSQAEELAAMVAGFRLEQGSATERGAARAAPLPRFDDAAEGHPRLAQPTPGRRRPVPSC